MKPNRQAKILELIAEKDIETQEQLLNELEGCGFATTQATISRDIKELRIIKELGINGIYRYSVSSKQQEPTCSAKLNSIFKQCVVTCDHAQNIVVIKTMPGLASAACSAMDAMDIETIIGTLAGDDTGFILMKDTASASALCSDVRRQLAEG